MVNISQLFVCIQRRRITCKHVKDAKLGTQGKEITGYSIYSYPCNINSFPFVNYIVSSSSKNIIMPCVSPGVPDACSAWDDQPSLRREPVWCCSIPRKLFCSIILVSQVQMLTACIALTSWAATVIPSVHTWLWGTWMSTGALTGVSQGEVASRILQNTCSFIL